jgi:hypothetical protein
MDPVSSITTMLIFVSTNKRFAYPIIAARSDMYSEACPKPNGNAARLSVGIERTVGVVGCELACGSRQGSKFPNVLSTINRV